MLPPASIQEWRTEHSAFHAAATFWGIWALVLLAAVNTLSKMRTILLPLLWAFFLVMALLPLTDLIEWCILQVCSLLPLPACCRQPIAARAEAIELEMEVGESHSQRGDRLSMAELSDTEPTADLEDQKRCCCHCHSCRGTVRTLAVLLVLVVFGGIMASFFIMIYESAVHMQKNWSHYEAGAKRATDLLLTLKDHLPEDVVRRATNQVVQDLETGISFALSIILEHVTGTVVELLMTFLYMIFWLCDPVHITESISVVFKRYILLKTLASGLYAICIWLLLQFLSIDLAIVFGLISFFLNFVPEVGPFLAIMLPVPVIVFDGRIERPFLVLGCALFGQLGLKFIFGNIVEVKLVERQQDMRMHPVVILFFVAFFGWVWGATGMLLSVPVTAAAKAGLHAIPPAYRDPLLIFLEGDKHAPERFLARQAQTAARRQ